MSNILHFKNDTQIKNKKTYSTIKNINNSIKLSDMKKNPYYRVSHKVLYDEKIVEIIKKTL